jgi:Pvc16 N-terminal domain
MADYQAVFAVGDALATFLQKTYDLQRSSDHRIKDLSCKFKLLSSQEMAAEDTDHDSAVTLFLHQITNDEHFRATTMLQETPRANGATGVVARQAVLFLDLHYLITYWGPSAQAEQTILTWTMQQLHSHATLDSSLLSLAAQDAGWDNTETIALTPVDLTLEDSLRIWESLGPKYRLSLSYVARVVRIDRVTTPSMPVVATSHGYSGVAS